MQSIQKINLEKLKKCDQIWEDMLPTEKGRICAKCQNTIIDFRELNDREVAEIHIFSTKKVCGIYNKEQRTISKPQSKINRFKSTYIGLIGLFTTINSSAQEAIDTLKTEQIEPVYEKQEVNTTYKNAKDTLQKKSAIIFGKISDEQGEVLIGVSVHLKEMAKGCTTNTDGFYNLDITKELEEYSKLTMVFSYLGYATQEIVINKKEMTYQEIKELNITLPESSESIQVFYVTRAPLHKRIWYGIKNIFNYKKG